MTQSSQLKIAVVGGGLIGRKHIEIVSRLAHLDAVIDPDPAARDLAAERGCTWSDDLDSYLGDSRPDGVIIATPNQLHLPHGSACLNAGIPALIEKPLAENSANARQLADLSDETGIPVLVGHHRRHSARAQAAKSILESGRLGRIVVINAQFWIYKPDDYFDMDWRRQEGGGPTYINLIHDVDLLRYFCGEVTYVQTNESHAVRGLPVEDTSAMILEFDTGALATATISDTVPAPWGWEQTSAENPAYCHVETSSYQIGGTDGSLSIPDLRLWFHPAEKSWFAPIDSELIPHDEWDPVEQQFRHFLDVIAGHTAPLVSAREGLRNLEVLEAIKNAAIHGGTQVVGAQAGPLPALNWTLPD